MYTVCVRVCVCVCACVQDVKKKISKCKDEKSPILDLSKWEVMIQR